MRDIVEKRYRLPRMVYLSVQCVSASIKENLEVNGSISNSSFSLEMKSLLEGYVKILGCSLNEAVKVVLDVAEGQRSLEVCIIVYGDFCSFFYYMLILPHLLASL